MKDLIAELEFSKDVHRQWAEWGRENPEALNEPSTRVVRDIVGAPDFHEAQIAKYEDVLRIVKAAEKLRGSVGLAYISERAVFDFIKEMDVEPKFTAEMRSAAQVPS